MLKLDPDANISKFLLTVQDCAGDVHFATHEGDILNLKSTLSQLVFVVAVADTPAALDGEVLLQNPQDFSALRRYLMKN